jgi:pentatricopeptide repeat protein
MRSVSESFGLLFKFQRRVSSTPAISQEKSPISSESRLKSWEGTTEISVSTKRRLLEKAAKPQSRFKFGDGRYPQTRILPQERKRLRQAELLRELKKQRDSSESAELVDVNKEIKKLERDHFAHTFSLDNKPRHLQRFNLGIAVKTKTVFDFPASSSDVRDRFDGFKAILNETEASEEKIAKLLRGHNWRLYLQQRRWKIKRVKKKLARKGKTGRVPSLLKLKLSDAAIRYQYGKLLNAALFHSPKITKGPMTGKHDLTQLESIFSDMEEHSAPTPTHYTMLMGAYNNNEQYDKCVATFERMLHNLVKPDRVAQNALLHAYVQSGRVDLARQTFSAMKQDPNSRPDAHTYSVMINAARIEGERKWALSLWQGMEQAQVV